MNFKQAANSLLKLLKKWLSLDMHLVNTCILGMMHGKRTRGRTRMKYIDNIKKWTRASLEENIRVTAWRERSCAAGAAITSELTTPTIVK